MAGILGSVYIHKHKPAAGQPSKAEDRRSNWKFGKKMHAQCSVSSLTELKHMIDYMIMNNKLSVLAGL